MPDDSPSRGPISKFRDSSDSGFVTEGGQWLSLQWTRPSPRPEIAPGPGATRRAVGPSEEEHARYQNDRGPAAADPHPIAADATGLRSTPGSSPSARLRMTRKAMTPSKASRANASHGNQPNGDRRRPPMGSLGGQTVTGKGVMVESVVAERASGSGPAPLIGSSCPFCPKHGAAGVSPPSRSARSSGWSRPGRAELGPHLVDPGLADVGGRQEELAAEVDDVEAESPGHLEGGVVRPPAHQHGREPEIRGWALCSLSALLSSWCSSGASRVGPVPQLFHLDGQHHGAGGKAVLVDQLQQAPLSSGPPGTGASNTGGPRPARARPAGTRPGRPPLKD